jgi:hypothetical protein
VIDLIWEEKLRFYVEQDHQMRNLLLERGILNDCYHPELEKVHLQNAKKLAALIKKYGFPVLSNAAEAGVRLSWLIVHHSISLPDFMTESLLQMRLAAGQRDYPLELLAHTEDLVAFLEGRKQLYGTHSDWVGKSYRLTPIEDPSTMNVRRKSVGLPPIGPDFKPLFLGRPPKDPEAREKAFREWLSRVGWRN